MTAPSYRDYRLYGSGTPHGDFTDELKNVLYEALNGTPDELKNVLHEALNGTPDDYDNQLETNPPTEDEDFPVEASPGHFTPHQPVDAQRDRAYYINMSKYWGQPKRDGWKTIVFVSAKGVVVQSRQEKIKDHYFPESMVEAFKAVRLMHGVRSFIVEGEYWHEDVEGKEHKTKATADKRNRQLGKADEPVHSLFGSFGVVGWDKDFIKTKRDQIHFAEMIMKELIEICPSHFKEIPTARTQSEKFMLAEQQEAEGREGEIWFTPHLQYHPGKVNAVRDEDYDGYVRTKHRMPPTRFRIIKVYSSNADGHTISGFDIADPDTGEKIGKVGTGYTRQQQVDIKEAFEADPDNTYALITANSRTIYGSLENAAFKELIR